MIKNDVLIFCRNIKKLRILNNISQREMAKSLGIGKNSIVKIEKGILPPRLSLEILPKLYEWYGITVSALFKE